jgi:hypothetical protein
MWEYICLGIPLLWRRSSRRRGMVRWFGELPERVGVEGGVGGDVVFDEFSQDTMTLGREEECGDGEGDLLPRNIEGDE